MFEQPLGTTPPQPAHTPASAAAASISGQPFGTAPTSAPAAASTAFGRTGFGGAAFKGTAFGGTASSQQQGSRSGFAALDSGLFGQAVSQTGSAQSQPSFSLPKPASSAAGLGSSAAAFGNSASSASAFSPAAAAAPAVAPVPATQAPSPAQTQGQPASFSAAFPALQQHSQPASSLPAGSQATLQQTSPAGSQAQPAQKPFGSFAPAPGSFLARSGSTAQAQLPAGSASSAQQQQQQQQPAATGLQRGFSAALGPAEAGRASQAAAGSFPLPFGAPAPKPASKQPSQALPKAQEQTTAGKVRHGAGLSGSCRSWRALALMVRAAAWEQ